MALQSINPATDQLVAEHPETTPDEVTRILRAARAASGSWRRTAPPERAASLRRAGALLRARKDELARMMAVEMGKPLAQGRAEAEKCAWVCDYYAEEGAGFLAPETIPTDASRSYAAFEPLGVVLAVMPWNFPLWQGFRFAAPALMAGEPGPPQPPPHRPRRAPPPRGGLPRAGASPRPLSPPPRGPRP